VGKVFDGEKLSIRSYLRIENQYLEAVRSFVKCSNIPYLRVFDLEKHNKKLKVKNEQWYSEELRTNYSIVEEGTKCYGKNIELICQLNLRNNLWCKLEYENKLFVHFGYDYYMYIVSSENNEELLKHISDSGLYVEPIVSPYL